MVLADWVVATRGVDPASHVRGTYDDEESCIATLISCGGIVGCVSVALNTVGIHRCETPQSGDIGIVRAPCVRRGRAVIRPCGALCVSPDRWALLTIDMGLVIAPLPVMRVWRV